MGLETDDVLISLASLADWQDRLVVIEAALDDVESDLRGRPPLEEYRAAFRHLYAAVSPLRSIRVEPKAMGSRWDDELE